MHIILRIVRAASSISADKREMYIKRSCAYTSSQVLMIRANLSLLCAISQKVIGARFAAARFVAVLFVRR